MESKLFELTNKWRVSIEIMNNVESRKLPTILLRVIRAQKTRKGEAFTEGEREQLEGVLGLTTESVNLLLDASSYIFEQAAYIQASTPQLKDQLIMGGLTEQTCLAFLKVWEVERISLLSSLKQRSLVPLSLSSTGWELHLQLAQLSLSRIKAPSALFQLDLANSDASLSSSTSSTSSQQFVQFELDHSQLTSLFHDLELIQSQLDRLSKQ